MNRMTIAALAALLAAPAALQAQTTVDARTATSARVEARDGDERQARAGTSVDAEVQATVRADLPREPVVRAAQRARARGRSEAEAARAAAQARVRLQTAQEAMVTSGRTATDAEIVAGADAMAAGAARADLERIARRAPDERELTASFSALARLGSRSGDFSGASSAIAARLASGTSDRNIGRLAASGSVDAMLRGSTAGLDAAGSVTGSVGSVLNGGAGVTGGLTGGIIP
jgi:hypothetical protein